LTYPTFYYYEDIFIEWAFFIFKTNAYIASIYIEIAIRNEARENRDLAIAFPGYAEIYNANYYKLLILSWIYPIIWIGASIIMYNNFQFFRDMVVLIQIEFYILLLV
jgi:hypothetical protein